MYIIKVKRIYESISEDDGYRILVDRLWPRGMSKEKAQVDMWAKTIAPSTKLRKEYHQNTHNYELFYKEYYKELENNTESIKFKAFINEKLSISNVTLLYSAKNMESNHALILKAFIEFI